MTREELVSEKDSLMLNAQIAFEARNDDIKKFIQDVIDSNGFSSSLTIQGPSFTSTLSQRLPSVTINLNSSRYIKLIVDFEYSTTDVTAADVTALISPIGLDYNKIYAGNSSEKKFVEFITAMINSLDSLDNLINSDVFKMYRSDLAAYAKAQQDIAKFDRDAKEAKLKSIAESFCAGQRIGYGNNYASVYPIVKVTNKRIWVDGMKYSNGHPKKSASKEDAAARVYNGTWKIFG